MRTVTLRHDYPVPPETLRANAIDYDVLAIVAKKVVTFYGLPSGNAAKGQQLSVEVSLFGLLPKRPYNIEVLECDDDEMITRTHEHGAGLKSWKHTMPIVPTETGSRLIDHVGNKAGLRTIPASIWAWFAYRSRHNPRMPIHVAQRS